MNAFDSDLAAGLLQERGYEVAEREEDADVILFNTCSVRKQAETRVFGQLTQLKSLKKNRPDLIVGVMGCMVENYKTQFFQDYPHVDILIGTRSIRELPDAIEKVRAKREQVTELAKAGFGYDLSEIPRRKGKIHAYLPIMTGCSKVCSFCVVPYVRGPELSRPFQEVLDQVKTFADSGMKHITLLGQNVNSYGLSLRGHAAKQPDEAISKPQIASVATLPRNDMSFTELLRHAAKVNGIEKISFMTSHPEDASEELFLAIRDEGKISRHFHLPLQSGSNKILEKMRRGHTIEEYKKKINRLRELVPDISITTDIICGFPGETEEDYALTKKALEEIQFDGAFIFRYSPRPHTAALRWDDTVPEREKTRRVTELLDLQKRITRKKNESFLGSSCKVLVEEMSRKSSKEILAHNWQEKKVILRGNASDIGSIANVKLVELVGGTFRAVKI